MSRWIRFSERRPPLGVPVIICSFEGWLKERNYDSGVKIVMKVEDGRDSDVVPVHYMTPKDLRRDCGWHGATISWFQKDQKYNSCWKYAGAAPSKQQLANGVKRAEAFWKSVEQTKRSAAAIQRLRWIERKAELLDLIKHPEKAERVETGSQKMHYLRIPEDWQIDSNPYVEESSACGCREGGYRTVVQDHVTCKNCRRLFDPRFRYHRGPYITVRF